jgi:hypothetical protein
MSFDPVAEMQIGFSAAATELCENGMTFRDPPTLRRARFVDGLFGY